MSDEVWVALMAAVPATIAAVSSLLNGREQKRVRKELAANGLVKTKEGASSVKKRPKKNGPHPDWYQPPGF